MSDRSALDMYESKRKLALVKAAGEGKLQKPPQVYAEKVDGKVVYKMKDGDDVTEIDKDDYISGLKAMKAYSRDIATVKNVLKNDGDSSLTKDDEKQLMDYLEKNTEALDKIASEVDDVSAADLAQFDKDDFNDENDEETDTDTEKELKDAKKALDGMSDDDIMDLADKDEKPEEVSDEQWEAAKKYKQAKDKQDKEDEEKSDIDSNDDENGRPQKPKRKIKKLPSKRDGYYKYVYKTQDGKPARASKADWQANVRAWKKYRRRLAKWEKQNSKKNESYITRILSDRLVVERFYPKDLTDYLKECFA